MRFNLDFNNCMSDTIGHEHGIRHEDIDALKGRAAEIHENLQKRRKTDPCLKHAGTSIGFYNLPYDEKLLKDVLSLSKELIDRLCEKYIFMMNEHHLNPVLQFFLSAELFFIPFEIERESYLTVGRQAPACLTHSMPYLIRSNS